MDTFSTRHIGPNHQEQQEMLHDIGIDNIDDLVNLTIPKKIRITFRISRLQNKI